MTSKRFMMVACAVIEDDGKVLAAQRSGSMSMPLKWEFPGGKLHDGENAEQCLARELEEELGIRVNIGHRLPSVRHDYGEFAIELLPFVCDLSDGRLMLNEHSAVAWVPPGALPELNWAEADIPVVASYLALLEEQGRPVE